MIIKKGVSCLTPYFAPATSGGGLTANEALQEFNPDGNAKDNSKDGKGFRQCGGDLSGYAIGEGTIINSHDNNSLLRYDRPEPLEHFRCSPGQEECGESKA